MKIEPREFRFLRMVAAVNDIGMAHDMAAAAGTRRELQSRMVGALIGRGLLEERTSSIGEGFFSDRPRSYRLHITPLGRECCEARSEQLETGVRSRVS